MRIRYSMRAVRLTLLIEASSLVGALWNYSSTTGRILAEWFGILNLPGFLLLRPFGVGVHMNATAPRTSRDLSNAVSLTAYVIAGVLSAGWLRSSLWDTWCATGRGSYFFVCTLWGAVMFLCFLLECFSSRGTGRVALRSCSRVLFPSGFRYRVVSSSECA